MLKQFMLGAALVVATTPFAFAATEADCTTLWDRPTVHSGGQLTPTYQHAMAASGRSIPADGTIDSATFMDACKAGVFETVKMDGALSTATADPTAAPMAPVPGANSFTQSQAKDRIEKAGFTGLSELTKDADGIWRGTAVHAGKPVSVALDFKGNVVAK